MSTLDALQRLSDGQFHLLGDLLLRRLELRYRRLRSHGVNERGESIKGQPDSYVGRTANSCTIAVCYSVQRRSWWKKVVRDVREAVATSPSVGEVVVVIPHNADRTGPKSKRSDWLSEVLQAVGRATFRLIDGRELASHLDTDHQDIRHELLGIPYSRLTASSILASAKTASASVSEGIRAGGRYDPDRYAPRSADRELYGLWQRCLRNAGDRDNRVAPIKMVALVNDSGVGKTSLVCAFADSLRTVLPVVLVQARDLAFGTEDALVAHVIHALQGVLDPALRVVEEAALTRHLASTVPLTLIVDGLDEAHDPDAVRKAITFWLHSRIGQASILIVTCRPEFWRICSDQSWKRWMSNAMLDDRSPVNIAQSLEVDRSNPDGGTRLPDRFSEAELEASWVQAGQPRAELYALPEESRAELCHPFTLRVYLDLCIRESPRPVVMARTDLMERWLNRRLDAEAVPTERIGRHQFQQALRIVATKIASTNGGAVSVDDLVNVPRFDPIHPPGLAVQRLIGANVLETVHGQPDRIRFTLEAVQDYYRAEADIEDIKGDPAAVAERFSKLRFTEAYPRLSRVGRQLRSDGVRHSFVRQLADLEPRMAAVVLGAAPALYSAELRAKVTQALGQDIPARHRVRAAFAITILGDLACPEAINVLVRHVLSPAEPHRYLKAIAATAFAKLGYSAAAEFVYKWGPFAMTSWDEPFYFREQLLLFRHANTDFRSALADHVVGHLASPSGTVEHARAVCVLAYLCDERLVEHLRSRLAEHCLLEQYENHALMALGTDAAGALFVRSVLAVGERLGRTPKGHTNDHSLISRVNLSSYDLRYLITPALEPHIQFLIESDDSIVSWIGSELAKAGLVTSLFFLVAVASAKRKGYWFDTHRDGHRKAVTAHLWLEWWQMSTDISLRKKLLRVAPLYPTPEIEEVLLDCLDSAELRGQAARQLGEYGAVRSASSLRQILSQDDREFSLWDKVAAANALGHLRDPAAVPLLQSLAATHPDTDAASHAVMSLGFIGTAEAEVALCDLFGTMLDEDEIVQGLIACGTRSAMAMVVARARERPDGPYWLCERIRHLTWTRGWTRGEYCTHVYTAELTEYLAATYQPGLAEQNWKLADAFRQIDSPEVRRLLREWAKRRGTPTDPLVRQDDQRRMSDMCYSELKDRGDEYAIQYVLDSRTETRDEVYVAFAADDLRHFGSPAVATEVRRRLIAAADGSQTLRMLSLLGRFGDDSDGDLVRRFLENEDDLVANVACESLMRLNDPILVPEHWREL